MFGLGIIEIAILAIVPVIGIVIAIAVVVAISVSSKKNLPDDKPPQN